jgi:ankyrin repeat protein
MESEILFPLIWKNQVNEVSQLLKNQNQNQSLPKDKYGCTALYWAIKIQSIDLVKLFLEYGSDPLELNQDGNSSWSILFEKRSDEIFQLCKNSIPKNFLLPREKFGKNFLHKAIESSEWDWALDLIPNSNFENFNALDDNGFTPLHIASECGAVEIVKAILESNPNAINILSTSKVSALHLACENDRLEVLQLLDAIEPSLDWNLTDTNGNTCLHYASENDSIEALEFILDHSVELRQRNNLDKTVFAIAEENKFHHVYKLLKKKLISQIELELETNPISAQEWIDFGKMESILKPEDLARLKIL